MKRPIVIVYVNFVDGVVSFARSGLTPIYRHPTPSSMGRLILVLNDLSYKTDGYSIRPHRTGFNAYLKSGGE